MPKHNLFCFYFLLLVFLLISATTLAEPPKIDPRKMDPFGSMRLGPGMPPGSMPPPPPSRAQMNPKEKFIPPKPPPDLGTPGPIASKECKFLIGKTCFDKDFNEMQTKAFAILIERYEKSCGENKPEYCYVLYRYNLAEFNLQKARRYLDLLCKEYVPFCLRELSRVATTGDEDWAQEILEIFCKPGKEDDKCLSLREAVKKINDKSIFEFAVNSWRVKTDQEKIEKLKASFPTGAEEVEVNDKPLTFELKPGQKIKFTMTGCKNYYYLAADYAMYDICDTTNANVKMRILASHKRLSRLLRENPGDLPFTKSGVGTVIENKPVGSYQLVTVSWVGR